MNTLWFDVTTTLHWRRPAVGVVRVETECFKYLAGLNLPNIRYCHFDKQAMVHREVAVGYVHEALKLHRPPQSQPKRETPARRMVDTTKRAISQMPTALSEPMLTIGRRSKPLLHTTLHNIRQARGKVQTMRDQLGQLLSKPDAPEQTGPLAVSAPFRAGDVLISAGLDWDQKDPVHLYKLKLSTGIKLVLVCYDLIPVLFPHLCVGEVAGIFSRYFVNVAWCADEVLCISKSSERDFLTLVREAKAPTPKTKVITLGSNLPDSGPKTTSIDDLVKGRFLLFVSTIERRKNHEVIYRAMVKLAEQGRTDLPKIVFVGMPGWGVHDLLSDLKFDLRVRDQFVMLNHMSDEQLAELYRRSEFTLYPSLYEGWGLPLAESLAYGKFCLSSNTSSLPEVAGDLVEYIDPWETNRWAERIAWYLDHPEEVAKREKIIRERYVAPTWEQTGRTLYEAAAGLLNPSAGAAAPPAA